MATKKAGKRTSAAEIERRVDEVMELIAAGLTRKKILQYVAEKATWEAAERTIDNYISRAGDKFALEAGYSREKEIGKAKRRYEMLFAASVKVQDYQRAIQAQTRLDNLLGLSAPKILELRNADAVMLNELLDQLKAQGIPASEVFQAMLQIVGQEKAEADSRKE